jgi:hypothetical protein
VDFVVVAQCPIQIGYVLSDALMPRILDLSPKAVDGQRGPAHGCHHEKCNFG